MIRKREREREREFVCMRGRAKKLSFVKFPREMFDRTTTRLTRKWNLFDGFQLCIILVGANAPLIQIFYKLQCMYVMYVFIKIL